MNKNQKDNKPNEDSAIDAFREEIRLLDKSKKYEEIIQKVNEALREEELSFYYYWRAVAHERIYYRDHQYSDSEELLSIISEDIDRAISIDDHELSLWLKCQLLMRLVSGSHVPPCVCSGTDVKEVGEIGRAHV